MSSPVSTGSTMTTSGVGAFPAVVVFQSDDVVLAQVVATLHFDNVHGFIERIGDAMHSADRHVGRFVNAQVKLFVIQRDARFTAYDCPVFRTLRMFLQGKDSAGVNDKSLDLKTVIAIDAVVTAPGSKHLAMQV